MAGCISGEDEITETVNPGELQARIEALERQVIALTKQLQALEIDRRTIRVQHFQGVIGSGTP